MRRALLFLSAVFVLQSCSSARLGPDRGLGSAQGKNYATVEVYYATDRESTGAASPSDRFGARRGEIQYGTAQVSIPRNHQMGRLEKPSILRLEFRAVPEKHVVLLSLEVMEKSVYFASLADRVKQSAKKSAFVFVHGYNVTFEDAARRTAQMSYDLAFDGAAVFYSWPSQGEVSKYLFDESNIAWSTANLVEFLTDFSRQSKADRIFLIGHSMGTRALTEAYLELIDRHPDLRSRFVEIILAAPDIDAAVFKRDIAPAIVDSGSNLTLYASSEDIPLKASSVVHAGYPRAGSSGPDLVLVEGMESIDATGVRTDFLNHSYALENRSVISDMFYIFRNGFRADQRAGLEEVPAADGASYWRFRE